MAPIPQTAIQPTVSAIYAAYETRHRAEAPRPHLGASVIGRECSRALWYSFRWALIEQHSGRLLRLFERGQREEALFVENLRAAGVTVHEVDPQTGRQFRFSDIGGHFGGSMDACIIGVHEAPKTHHVCEFKTHNAKSFAKLQAEGVEKSNPEHVAQMQCYMHWSGMARAFYLAVCKDNDELYSERIKYNKEMADALLAKARRIIAAQEPPARLSERPDWYLCQWCAFKGLCHARQIPQANCRTCCHATPELDGDGRWSCARFNCDLAPDTQARGGECFEHRFIPALLPWTPVDADAQANWIKYDNGLTNGGDGFQSREIAANAALCDATDPVLKRMRAKLQVEVVG